MNSTPERLAWLYRFGHARNPQYQNLLGADEASIKKMNGEEQDAKLLVKSFQESDLNVALIWSQIAKKRYGEYNADGELDPATTTVMEFARCAMPDFAPRSNESFDTGDPDLNAAIASMSRWNEEQERAGTFGATGTGSWPVGCDPEWKQNHSVVVAMDTSGATASQKTKLVEILKYVEACEAEIGQHVRHVLDQQVTAQHNVVWGFLAGSVIGYSYFPTPNTCNQRVQCKLDSSYDAKAITLANLFTHEYKGHSDGLNHTRGGIMNPSIITYDPLTWKTDVSFSIKKRYFGGEPINVTPPVPPTPTFPPVQGDIFAEQVQGSNIIAIRGDLRFDNKYNYIVVPSGGGKYHVVPKPIV